MLGFLRGLVLAQRDRQVRVPAFGTAKDRGGQISQAAVYFEASS